jgi:predicted RNA-binding protein YlxR (DUF448 family)
MTLPAATVLDSPPRRARPRRDLASGKAEPRGVLVRFVVGPDRAIVPDIGRRLPGRGLWLSPSRDVLKMAAAGRGRVFARAAGGPVAVPLELDRLVERLLVERIVGLIGLARRGGAAVTGFERVRESLASMKPSKDARAVLFVAADAPAPDRRRLKAIGVEVAVSQALTASELGSAFGRDTAVFAVVAPGKLARDIGAEASRLALLRAGDEGSRSFEDRVKDDSAR